MSLMIFHHYPPDSDGPFRNLMAAAENSLCCCRDQQTIDVTPLATFIQLLSTAIVLPSVSSYIQLMHLVFFLFVSWENMLGIKIGSNGGPASLAQSKDNTRLPEALQHILLSWFHVSFCRKRSCHFKGYNKINSRNNFLERCSATAIFGLSNVSLLVWVHRKQTRPHMCKSSTKTSPTPNTILHCILGLAPLRMI